jgi:catechol 2,3-dioxygenase-like lactoylglutathione lyase family enzyme
MISVAVAWHMVNRSMERPSIAKGSAIPGQPVMSATIDQKEGVMILGAHVIVYSQDASADRAFFRDVLGFSSVDAGNGWLIFALPPSEVAVHPADEGSHELYLMCADLGAEMAVLDGKGVRCSEVHEERWGSVTSIRLPGGGDIGLYQPKHPLAVTPTAE